MGKFSPNQLKMCCGINILQLAQRDTPIHQWNIPNVPKEFSLFIKRDDLTGCALSGNKVIDINYLILCLSVSTYAVIGQLSGPYSPVWPTKI